jgi:capsid protein
MRAAYQRCEWVGDAPGQIDPVKEITAAEKRINVGVSSLERETMAFTGVDWKDIHRQRTREHAARVAAGLEPPIMNATATEPVVPAGDEGDAGDSEEEDQPKKPEGGK